MSTVVKLSKDMFLRVKKAFFNENFFNCILCTLFFLFGLNLFQLSPLFLTLIIVMCLLKIILFDEFRIRNSLFLVLAFAFSYFLFNTIHHGISLKSMAYYIFFPIGIYLVGENLVYNHRNKGKLLFNCLFWLSVGFCLYASLDAIARIFRFGFNADSRLAVSFWTSDTIVATIVGAMLPMIISCIFPVVYLKYEHRKRYHLLLVIFGLVCSLYITFALRNRSTLIIMVFSFVFGLIYTIICDKKHRTLLLVFLITSVSVFAGIIICYLFKVSFIYNLINEIPILNRFFQEGIIDKGRIDFFTKFFANFFKHPFGGKMLEGDYYFHNVWLDIYDAVGIIPASIFIAITIHIIVHLITIGLSEKNSFIKIFLTLFIGSLFLIFAIEPMQYANFYVFILFFLCYGIADGVALYHKKKLRMNYSKSLPEFAESKIAIINNFFNIHQYAFCQEMYKKFGNNFHFIGLEKAPESFAKLGYLDEISPSYVVDMTKEREKALEIIESSNILICGSVPISIVKSQAKKGKIIFKACERIFKSNNPFFHLLPHQIYTSYRYYKSLQRYQLYYLSKSAYLSIDLDHCDIDVERCYKWAYFTLENNHKSFDALYSLKNRSEMVELLYVNRIIGWKHPEKCLVVANALSKQGISFRLRIIGNGEPALIERINKSIIENHLEKNVFYLGGIKNNEVRKIMEESNVLLSFSDFNEGWGACNNEGMESGCVVISSHSQGAVPFLIENGENGIIYELNNDVDLCKKVLDICQNKDKQRAIGEKAFHTIKDVWSAQEAVKRLAKITENIINNNDISTPYKDGPMSKSEIIPNNYFSKKF